MGRAQEEEKVQLMTESLPSFSAFISSLIEKHTLLGGESRCFSKPLPASLAVSTTLFALFVFGMIRIDQIPQTRSFSL